MTIKNRVINSQIEQQLFADHHKILILLGPRQVGKTTLMKHFFNLLLEKKEKALFLDMDIYEQYEQISTYGKFINFLLLNGYDTSSSQYFYVFLDEFQNYEDFTKILKNLYDNHPNIKIIASGSSSLTIKNNIQETLAGRKRIINIFPLNFEEFLLFKEEHELLAQLKNIKKLNGTGLSDILGQYYQLLEEFMLFGGYPAVVLEPDMQEKQRILGDIFDLFIKKDVGEYLKLEKIRIVSDLLKYLAVNNGNKIKYDDIAKTHNIPVYTVKNYLQILKELFILVTLPPYFTNKNLELVKVPKIYFLDNGVRNYFIKNFVALELRPDKGNLFEGFFIGELLKSGIDTTLIKYRNDKNQREVDVIIDNVDHLQAYELKYKKHLNADDLVGVKAFGKAYKADVFLVNLAMQEVRDGISFILPFIEK